MSDVIRFRSGTRVLTICNAGRVRSRALANLLNERGHDAFAVGLKNKRAMELGLRWAEIVMVVSHPPEMTLAIIKKRPDAIVVPTGPDIWGRANCPKLRTLLTQWLKEEEGL